MNGKCVADCSYLFILPHGDVLGGVEIWVYSMVRRINVISSGSARILSLQDSGALPEDLSEFIIRVDISDFHSLREAHNLEKVIKMLLPFLAPSVYVFPNYGSHSYAIALALKAKRQHVEVVGHLHSDDSHYYNLARYFSPFIERYICVSEKIQSRLREMMPWRGGDVLVRPCGIDMVSSAKIEGCREFGLILEECRIIYVGRLTSYQKRVFDLVELVERLINEKGIFYIDVVGDGEDRRELEKRIAALRKSNVHVVFHGRVHPAKVNSLLEQAHIFYSCSSFEGTSIALLEALSAGCLPVVTDVSGVDDIKGVGAAVWSYPEGNIQESVYRIKELCCSDSVFLERLSKQNRLVSKRFDMGSYVEWFLSEFPQARLRGDSFYLAGEVYRNWDCTWNPAIFARVDAHPLFRIYDDLKKKWYGRAALRVVKFIFGR